MRANSGWTALHCAARKGHKTVARLLLDNWVGVDAKSVDMRGVRLLLGLQESANSGHAAVVHLLLEKGLDITATVENGWIALH
jgi:ankyrin repeat protein